MNPEWLITYLIAGILLNSAIKFEFKGDPPIPWLDNILTIVAFYIIWPLGLILFTIKWYQGKASFKD